MSGKAREASTYRAANRNYARLLREVKRVFSEVTRVDGIAVPAKPIRRISWREAVHFARKELHGNMAKK
jgi:hypothetical protein